MSAVDWYEMSHLAYSNAAQNFAMILTMASAYLVVGYLVGSKLTRTQLISINVVFIPAMMFFIYLFYGFTMDGASARAQAAEIVPEISVMPSSWEQPFGALALLVALGALFISVKFMRDVRRQLNVDD